MNIKWLKVQMDKLRSEASRGPVPSSVIFTLTDPIMDKISAWEYPRYHACCGYSSDGPHNDSCPIIPAF
jgi:hypothetical protein